MENLTRDEVITKIVDCYTDDIIQGYLNNDLSFLDSILRGEGFTPIPNMSDTELEEEYYCLFDGNIKIINK